MHCSLHPELAPQSEIYILRQDRETVAGDENRLFSCKGFFYDFLGGFFQDSFEEDDFSGSFMQVFRPVIQGMFGFYIGITDTFLESYLISVFTFSCYGKLLSAGQRGRYGQWRPGGNGGDSK